jgi:hypothetical protein
VWPLEISVKSLTRIRIRRLGLKLELSFRRDIDSHNLLDVPSPLFLAIHAPPFDPLFVGHGRTPTEKACRVGAD